MRRKKKRCATGLWWGTGLEGPEVRGRRGNLRPEGIDKRNAEDDAKQPLGRGGEAMATPTGVSKWLGQF